MATMPGLRGFGRTLLLTISWRIDASVSARSPRAASVAER